MDRSETERQPLPAARLLRVVNELAAARDLPAVIAIVRSAAGDLTDADGVTFVRQRPAPNTFASSYGVVTSS
jgi:hypothetical protein